MSAPLQAQITRPIPQQITRPQALGLLVLTAALWSLGGVLIKSTALHPLAIAGARSAIAGLVLLAVTRRLQFTWTRVQIGAAIGFASTVILFVVATKLTTAANAILLQYTAPVYVALLSAPLLGERLTKRDWLALAAVAIGMGVFFLEKASPAHALGNVVALLSGLSFAALAICLRMQNGVSTLESIFLGHLLTAIAGIPFFFAAFGATAVPTSRDVITLLVLGVIQLGIPYVLYGIAVRHVTALEATLIPVLEPILNPIWVALFNGETPSEFAVIGGSIVIGSVLIHALTGLRARPAQPAVS